MDERMRVFALFRAEKEPLSSRGMRDWFVHFVVIVDYRKQYVETWLNKTIILPILFYHVNRLTVLLQGCKPTIAYKIEIKKIKLQGCKPTTLQ